MTEVRLKKRGGRQLEWGIMPFIIILTIFVVVAVFADYIAPYRPDEVNLTKIFAHPIWEGGTSAHLLGTDSLGRDILSRIIHGARISLIMVIIAISLGGSVGSVLGILAGYRGGWVDVVISGAVDVMLGFPTVLVAMLLAVLLGASMSNVVLVIALLIWARYARQARGEVLKIREMEFVTLARTAGCSHMTIMLRHVLPNVVNSLIVIGTFQVGWVITLEATLSFLGCGIPPPTPSWGSMVSDGRSVLASAWWVSFMPGLAIMLVVLAANLFGDWLRDRLDPKLRDL
jgi:peptide/nickel transport system permease protein